MGDAADKSPKSVNAEHLLEKWPPCRYNPSPGLPK
jgi:hypothetical protein